MKVKDIIGILRNEEQKISIRKDNWFYCVTKANTDLINEIKDREIIDIIPNIDIPGEEKNAFVINVR